MGATWTKKRRSRDKSYAKDALAYGSLVQADHDAAQDVVPLVGTGQQRHRVIQGFIRLRQLLGFEQGLRQGPSKSVKAAP